MSTAFQQRVAVIGLGRFGMALARRLSAHGADVLAIDNDPELIREIADDVSIAVTLDSTNEAALRSQEVDRVDAVVIAIGENFEAALLTTVICKKNLKLPRVICRAQTAFHAEIFGQIGADEVVQPERAAGEMLGRRLAHPRINDYIKLADGFTVVELEAPRRFLGKTVREINLRTTWQVNLIAIKRAAPADENTDDAHTVATMINVPGPDDRIEAGDLMLLAGSDEALSGLPRD